MGRPEIQYGQNFLKSLSDDDRRKLEQATDPRQRKKLIARMFQERTAGKGVPHPRRHETEGAELPVRGPRGTPGYRGGEKLGSALRRSRDMNSDLLEKSSDISRALKAGESKLPVVYDTNVLVAGVAKPADWPAVRAVNLILDHAVELCVTPPIVEEYEIISAREDLGRFRLDREGRELFRKLVRGAVDVWEARADFDRAKVEDPSDGKFIQALRRILAGGMLGFIVTYDRHLLEAPLEDDRLQGKILRPQELLDLRREGS